MRVRRLHAAGLGSCVRGLIAAATLVVPARASAAADGGDSRPPAHRPTPRDSTQLVPGIAADRMVAPASLLRALAVVHGRIPSFSRQTKLACSACHYQFPQLTPFGRLFKLNGYTLTGLETIGQPADSSQSLKLAPIPPAAAMLVTSLNRTSTPQPETQNNTMAFPQQLSLFLAGQVTPNVGAFTQFTYAAPDGKFGIDNVDIRYASHASFGTRDLLFGLTLHNNPTVQDVWNTTPAWGYPFIGSEVAPSPMASTIVEGTLSQQVVGLGAYSLWGSLLYTELTLYRSAPQEVKLPLDSTATNATKGVAPYWRVAIQHQGPSTYVMVGTYGLTSQLYPTGITGPVNKYTDLALDAQIEQKVGEGTLIGRAAFIHENQTLDGSLAAATPTASIRTNTLKTFRTSASLLPSLRYGMTLGYFLTSGGTDAVLYPEAPVSGSGNGSPDSSGLLGEFTFNPWQNTRLGAQYVAYQKFNGGSTNYDAAGRNASGNNTLYLYMWLAF